MAELLTADEVATALGGLEEWSGDPTSIARTVSLTTFPAAIGVVDRVAVLAERLDHHPDIDIRWRMVTFTCATHTAGGVTGKDIELARQIDGVVETAPRG